MARRADVVQLVTLIHEEDGRYGASFPDLPGCTTVAADPDTLLAKAREVAAFHVAGMAEDGLDPPVPRPLAGLKGDTTFEADARGAMIALVDVDWPSRSVRVNITLDEGILRRIDRAARQTGESRSGFLVAAAKERLRRTG